ncbi:discoidin domain-containing protein [Paenibacillus sp. GCM10027626]|uniref:discoidin domain-containing protein n=1 Tax=Paenibacillus sp. GCM10027626 TaxID=3273411 RepID=UPI003635A996
MGSKYAIKRGGRGKKALAVWLAALVAVSGIAFSAPSKAAAVVTPGAPEVRLTATAITASSSKAGHRPELVQDGLFNDEAKSWIPAARPTASEPQWILFDFGHSVRVGALEAAVTSNEGPKSYAIQISSDGTRFRTVATKSVKSSRTLFSSWDAVEARYVRLYITDSFGDDSAINEITVYPDMLPHRVGVLSCFPDMNNFGDKGFDSLRAQHQQLANVCVSVADPGSPGINIMPELIDNTKFPNGISAQDAVAYVSDPTHYSWSYADPFVNRFVDNGLDIWLGFQGITKRAFPDFYSDIIDESGRKIEHRDFFNETSNRTIIEIAKQTVRHFDSNPYVRMFSILGPGWFGGIEYYSGSNPELLAVYSDSAQRNFRQWLARKYGTVAKLNEAWGKQYGSFDEILSPLPNRTNANAVDSRPEWADLMFWKIEYMDKYIADYMAAIRSVSDKPIHVEVDGGYQSAPMETGESMGKIARDISKYDNVILGNSNLDAPYGVAHYTATAKFYKLQGSMDDTAQPSGKVHSDNAFNFLSRGAGTLEHSALGWDYGEFNDSRGKWDPSGEYAGNDLYRYTKDNAKKFREINPKPSGSDVLIFNPWYANLFRKGYDRNDHNFIFDADHGISWYGSAFASWTHYLDSPDLMDDFPIEDGALANYKVFISPNMDLTLTSDKGEERIKDWVNKGGAFVSFGKDSFNYRLNLDTQRVTGSEDVSAWMMGMSGGAEAAERVGTKVKVSANAPAWLKSLAPGQTVSVSLDGPSQGKAFKRLVPGAVPVLEDEGGNVIMSELKVGKGSVLFSTLPVANNAMFKDTFMSRLLSDYADSRGIKRTVTFDPDKFHVVDAGEDAYSGKQVIEVARNAAASANDVLVIKHAPSLDNVDAIIDLNWEKDSLIHYTFKPGKAFVYVPSPEGAITGSATIEEANGKQLITLDLGNRYAIQTIALDAEHRMEGLTFDNGTYGTGWKTAASAFGNAPVQAANGEYMANSSGGAGSLGKISSSLFTVTDDVLAFRSSGYKGAVSEAKPPETPPKLIAGFETGDWSELAYIDTNVFGSAPATDGAGWVKDWGGHYAASSIGGQLKGRLQTKNFVIDRPTLTFKGAGWNGISYDTGPWPYPLNNRFYLKDAETGQVLIEQAPENQRGDSDMFRSYAWDVSAYAGREVYFEMVDAVGAEEAAQYGGGFDWLAVDDIMLTGEPFDAPVLPTGFNAYYLKAVDGTVLRIAYPPDNDGIGQVAWDVSNLKGKQVYFEAVQGNDSTENGWFAFGNLFGYNNKDHIEDPYWSFESGTYDGWERTGNAFPAEPNSVKMGRPLGTDNGKYWADSLVSGENATGTLTSKAFVIEKPFLTFLAAGWNGQDGWDPPKNYYELIGQGGERLRIATPPGMESQPLNQFIKRFWDVSDLVGQTVRFRMVDGDTASGYAWLALDSITQEDNFNFECGCYTTWTTTGTAFGSAPSGVAEHPETVGARGSKWEDSRAGGVGAVGTITSVPFTLRADFVRFLAAGYGDNGNNYYRLVGEDGNEIGRTAPPDDSSFKMLTIDAAGHAGSKVRFEAVDGSADASVGWLAFDDLNWRQLLPDRVALSVSNDGTEWTKLADWHGKEATRLSSALAEGENVRYVRFELPNGKIDLSFLDLIRIQQRVETVASGMLPQDGLLDLGADKQVNGIQLAFDGNPSEKSFRIEASANGRDWSQVYKAIDSKKGVVQAMFPSITARYIRISGGEAPADAEITVYRVSEPALSPDYVREPADGTGNIDMGNPSIPSDGGSVTPGAAPAPLPELSITRNGVVTTVSVSLKAALDPSTGKASVQVDDRLMAELLNKAMELLAEGKQVEVAIRAESAEKADAVVVDFPGDAWRLTANAFSWSLRIDAGIASVAFDAKAVASLSAAANAGNISIRISKAAFGALTLEAQAKIGDRPVYDFAVMAGEEKLDSFGVGAAEIHIPYTPKPGEQKNAIIAYAIDEAGKLNVARGRYDDAKGAVRIKTAPFMSFAVGYNEVGFKDVAGKAWYHEAVAFISARDIVRGLGGGLFAPERNVTRADFLIMVMNAYGIEADADGTGGFADAGNKYYTRYLGTAKRLGLVSGTGGGNFSPESFIRRQDMMVILYRALETLGELPTGSSGHTLKSFPDSDGVAKYARTAMQRFVEAGIMNGNGKRLAAPAFSTRAEAVQVLYRLLTL